MRNAAVVVCFVMLVLGFGDAGALRSKPVKAFSPRTSLPPPPQVIPTLPPRLISVGDVVTGILTTGLIETLYEFTAPFDGTLFVTLDWNPSLESLSLSGQNAFFSYLRFGSPTLATLRVTAGHTYRFWVYAPSGFDYFYYESTFIGPVPFVLTTSLEPCTSVLPSLGWVCVSGGWVPSNHPLALPPPPAPTSTTPPPVVDGISCPSVKPGADWICTIEGGWVPPGHILATSAVPSPAPPPPPVPSNTCTTPDPFVGIPGLSGVCINGGWVPIGHPLARGGG